MSDVVSHYMLDGGSVKKFSVFLSIPLILIFASIAFLPVLPFLRFAIQ